MTGHNDSNATRRGFLANGARLAGGLALVSVFRSDVEASTETMQDAIRKVVGETPVRQGRVTLDVPALVENGNTVAVSVKVDSPMSTTEHVKAIHLFNEKNPQPNVAVFHLGPRSGRASVATRIRLADTQQVVALAEMNDGSFWSASANVIVTLAACTEELR